MNKAKATLIIAIILIVAYLSVITGGIPQAQPMTIKRESAHPIQGEIIEGRTILINLASGRVWVMEV